eukprot:5336862-Amphidinium_carterae.1
MAEGSSGHGPSSRTMFLSLMTSAMLLSAFVCMLRSSPVPWQTHKKELHVTKYQYSIALLASESVLRHPLGASVGNGVPCLDRNVLPVFGPI